MNIWSLSKVTAHSSSICQVNMRKIIQGQDLGSIWCHNQLLQKFRCTEANLLGEVHIRSWIWHQVSKGTASNVIYFNLYVFGQELLQKKTDHGVDSYTEQAQTCTCKDMTWCSFKFALMDAYTLFCTFRNVFLMGIMHREPNSVWNIFWICIFLLFLDYCWSLIIFYETIFTLMFIGILGHSQYCGRTWLTAI